MSLTQKRSDRTEHQYTAERLSAYLDGELASPEKRRVEQHLARCPHCQWDLHTLRATVQWTRQLPVVPVPRAFTVPVPARPVRAARPSWSLPLLQGATALVALLFLSAALAELFLPRLLPASAPRGVRPVETAAVMVEVTKEVEAAPPGEVTEVAVPVAEVATTPAEAEAVTMAAEAEVATPAAALPAPAEPTRAPVAKQALEAAVTPTPQPAILQATGRGAAPDESGIVETQVVQEAVEAPSDALQAKTDALAAPPTEPPPATPAAELYAPAETAAPAPVQPALAPHEPPSAAPTAVAALPPAAPAEVGAGQEPIRETEQAGSAVAGWLATAVIGLGVAFVLLGTITVIAMARRLTGR